MLDGVVCKYSVAQPAQPGLGCAQPDIAIYVLYDGRDVIASRSSGIVEHSDLAIFDPIHTFSGAHPDASIAAFVNALCQRAAEPHGGPISDDFTVAQAVHAGAQSAHPHAAFRVLIDGHHHIVAQAGVQLRKGVDAAAGDAAQPAHGPGPHVTGALVQSQGKNRAMRKPVSRSSARWALKKTGSLPSRHGRSASSLGLRAFSGL